MRGRAARSVTSSTCFWWAGKRAIATVVAMLSVRSISFSSASSSRAKSRRFLTICWIRARPSLDRTASPSTFVRV